MKIGDKVQMIKSYEGFLAKEIGIIKTMMPESRILVSALVTFPITEKHSQWWCPPSYLKLAKPLTIKELNELYLKQLNCG